MKKCIKILGIIFLLIVAIGTIFWVQVSANMKNILEEELRIEDFEEFQDGNYEGSYYYEDQIGASVSLVIEEGTVVYIEINNHLYGFGEKAEVITNNIISEQTLNVDVIAGATTSSKVIKLAIQNALENGVIE